MPVLLENLQDAIKVNNDMMELIKHTVETCLKAEGFDTPAEVSILLVDNEKIRTMNNEFRGIDRATDVLSFPIVDMKNGEINTDEGDFDLDEKLLILGDIVVSLEKTVEQAEEYGHKFERELAFLVTHGIFHLLGYDHETLEDSNLMFKKQEAVLAILGLKR